MIVKFIAIFLLIWILSAIYFLDPFNHYHNDVYNKDRLIINSSVQDGLISNNQGHIKNNNVVLPISNSNRGGYTWPPLKNDKILEGAESLPLVEEVQVPKFYHLVYENDLYKVVDSINDDNFYKANPSLIENKIDNHETIFIMIASYRDFQCQETIQSIYSNAKYPSRIYIGAVDQIVDGDTSCLDFVVSCEDGPSQVQCKYLSNISRFKMDASLALGPVTARHIGNRLYRGQSFYLQLDAHCKFVRDWDTQLINQWKNIGNEMAVLSSYLSDVRGAIDSNGNAKPKTRPLMCNSDFEGTSPTLYLRHGAQPECEPAIPNASLLQPYWAAGFSFSKGHFNVRVPYDGYQPMVFQGEEIGISVRGFTHGYDFYAPPSSLIFHEYATNSDRRKKIPTFWENSSKNKFQNDKMGLKRGLSIIKLIDIPYDDWNHEESDLYGLGNIRKPELFYKLFLIDVTKKKIKPICPFVRWGAMTRHFSKYINETKMGVDYSNLVNFNTQEYLEDEIKKQIPVWRSYAENAIKSNDYDGLLFAYDGAKRFKANIYDPELISLIEESLRKMRKVN